MLGGFFYSLPFTKFVFPGPSFITGLTSLAIFIAVTIPIMFLVLIVVRVLTKYSAPKGIRRGMGGLWLFSAAAVILFGISMGRAFSVSEDFNESFILDIPGDTLHIKIKQSPYKESWKKFDHLAIGKDALFLEDVSYSFVKSTDGKFKIDKNISSYGATLSAARKNINKVVAPIKWDKNTVWINDYLELPRSAKVRDQEIDYTIHIPEGKFIYLDGKIYRTHKVQLRPDAKHPRLSGNVWQMSSEGLLSPDYVKEYTFSKKLDLSGFNEVRTEGKMTISIERGEEYKVEFVGKEEYVESIESEMVGSGLLVKFDKRYPSVPVQLNITMPGVNHIDVANPAELSVKGFKQPKLDLQVSGNTDVHALLEVDNLSLSKSGRGEFELRGAGKLLDVYLDDNARLDAEQFKHRTLKIEGAYYWRAKTPSIDTIITHRDNIRLIEYKGRTPVLITD